MGGARARVALNHSPRFRAAISRNPGRTVRVAGNPNRPRLSPETPPRVRPERLGLSSTEIGESSREPQGQAGVDRLGLPAFCAAAPLPCLCGLKIKAKSYAQISEQINEHRRALRWCRPLASLARFDSEVT